MKTLIVVLLFFISPFTTTAQVDNKTNRTQTFRGTVIDGLTQQVLIGATVIVQGTDPVIVGGTDMDGNFALQKVPVGRQVIEVQYMGYATYVSDGIIVTTAKEPYLEISMSESMLPYPSP